MQGNQRDMKSRISLTTIVEITRKGKFVFNNVRKWGQTSSSLTQLP